LVSDDLQHELDVAVHLARRAGEAILSYYHTSLAVDYKADDEPVTAADRAADDLISAGLRGAFPDYGLLTEESDDDLTRLERERVWIVDPLDGTTEFLAESGESLVYNQPKVAECRGLVGSNGLVHDRIVGTLAALRDQAKA
jgi:myo-inositol-1(or 4)-monophosphatase